MASFNKITIVGYLGRDPELRYTPSGTPVCDFSVATTEKKKSQGETEEATTWFRVSMWGRQAEVASQFLEKGKLAYIEGRLTQREWTDRDGNKRTTLEVHGTDMQFIGSRGDAEARSAAAGAGASSKPAVDEALPEIDDSDLPF